MIRSLALLGATAALLAASPPASAQYYGGYDRGYDRPPPYDYGRRPPPRGYDEDDDDYRPRRRPPLPYGYDDRFSRTCITARGACPTRPLPRGTPCGCEIPGFGYKRGATG